MSALERISSAELAANIPPAGSRTLGVRVKPIIRLGMGHKDPERGFPVKDDHFTVRGDDRAVAKFLTVKGENPKSVEILLPSELDQALTIQYRAFKGGASEDGGTLVAVGATNYALRDYVGGPDVLTVFNQDGTVEEVETAGVDANTKQPLDKVAQDLGLEMYTTLRAGMPEVLGFGSFFEISTKGKESTDNLWAKLRELYSLFGARVSFAVKPQLVIRPSTARPVVQKRGEEPKRIKTTIYVLDVVVPETIDEMIGRLASRQAAIGDPAHALYGPAALPAATPPEAAADAAADRAPAAGGGQQVEEPGNSTAGGAQLPPASGTVGTGSSTPDEDHDDPEPEPALEGELVDDDTLTAASAVTVPDGAHAGKPISEVTDQVWLKWALRQPRYAGELHDALETWVHAHHPDVAAWFDSWVAAGSPSGEAYAAWSKQAHS